MSRNLWLPFWIGLTGFVLVLPTVLLLPETRRGFLPGSQIKNTLPQAPTAPDASSETTSLLSRRSTDYPDAANASQSFRSYMANFKVHFLAELHKLRVLLTSNRNFTLCLSIFLVTSLTRAVLNILIQYISKRYDQTIAEATYFFSLKAAVTLALFSIIIPGGLHILVSWRGYERAAANLLGAKLSLLCIGGGVLAIGLCSELWMLAIGRIPSSSRPAGLERTFHRAFRVIL
jgi:hypothetical protein